MESPYTLSLFFILILHSKAEKLFDQNFFHNTYKNKNLQKDEEKYIKNKNLKDNKSKLIIFLYTLSLLFINFLIKKNISNALFKSKKNIN